MNVYEISDPVLPRPTDDEGNVVPGAVQDKRISKKTAQDAEETLRGVLGGPYRRLVTIFGAVRINDSIPIKGSSREAGRPGSEHFKGAALDLDTSEMNNQEKIRLVAAALAAGFTGFGFNENFLHVDIGRTRYWGYGNDSFAGVPIDRLGSFVKSNARPMQQAKSRRVA